MWKLFDSLKYPISTTVKKSNAISHFRRQRRRQPPFPSPDGMACFVHSCWTLSIDGVWYVNTLMHFAKERIIFSPGLSKELHNGKHKVPFHMRLDVTVRGSQMNAVVSDTLIGYSAWLDFSERCEWQGGEMRRIWADLVKLWNQADCWGWGGR